MFDWAFSLLKIWQTWTNSYAGGPIMDIVFPYALGVSIIVGFSIGMSIAKLEDCSFWETFGAGLLGALIAGICGSIVTAALVFSWPVVVLLTTITGTLAALFVPIYYGGSLIPLAKSLFGHMKTSFKPDGTIRRFCRKIMNRRKPKDHLNELDKNAEEIASRLKQLVNQKDLLVARERERVGQLAKARAIHAKLAAGSAAADIATDIITKFDNDILMLKSRTGRLQEIISQIQTGQKEMENLIALAQLARQAKETDIQQDDTRAIQAARDTLEALRKAFEQADAALTAVVIENDMDLDRAFRQMDEGLQRNNRLDDAADNLNAPPPARIRA